MRDLHYAFRMLLRSRGFSIIAVACLALGIGATTAVYSIVDAVVFRPLPYPGSDRLVRLYSEFPRFPNGGLRRFPVSPPEFREMQRDLKSYERVEAWSVSGINITTSGEPLRTTATGVSGELMGLLGVRPLRGRLLAADDDREGAPLTAVISYELWGRAFGSDPGVTGRTIRIDGSPATVVGVMPPAFRFPPGQTEPSELWVPLQLTQADLQRRGNHRLAVVGKLRGGVGLAAARQELSAKLTEWGKLAAPRFHSMHPEFHPIIAHEMQNEVVRTVRPAMLVILGAAGFVLLIACVNVANLLLARAESRQKEIAVRVAMGAARTGLMRQFLMEGLLLAGAGCVAGLALAYAGVRVLLAAGSQSIPRASEVTMDLRVLLFSVGLLFATALIFGLAPMAQALGRNVHETLKAASGRTSATVQANWLRRGMVVAQLALALVLLISTALMVRSFWKLQAVDVGFRTANLLTMRVALPAGQYPTGSAVNSFVSRLESRLETLPGVVSAGLMAGMVPQRPANMNDTEIENFVQRPGGPVQNVDFWQAVGRGFFKTLGTGLREGRFLDERDGEGANPVVVVNETMARTFWPGQSAVGRRVRAGGPNAPWLTIVGVVEDMKNAGPDRPAGTELFFPYGQTGRGFMRVVQIAVRTPGDPMTLSGPVRRLIAELDPSLPVTAVRSMEQAVAETISRPRFLSILLSLFTAVALVLAAIGVYGVVSYSVAQRTTEIGVRMAVGAEARQILRMILRQGLTFGLAGIAFGLAGSYWLTRFMQTILFGVQPFDAATFTAMTGALLGVTLLACWIPARRATRVDPMIALRYE